MQEEIFNQSVDADVKDVRPAKRVRRTNDQIEADRKAEREALRAEVISELEEQGLIKDDAEVQADMEKAAIEAMTFPEIIRKIQNLLKAPKTLTSRAPDGHEYKYRTAEQILKAAKPLCARFGCHLKLDSELDYRSDVCIYQKVTASVVRDSTGEVETAVGYARECPNPSAESHDQNSFPKATGSSQTYAKKYALSNLLAIDDSSDDPDEQGAVDVKETVEKKMTGNSGGAGDARQMKAPQTPAAPTPASAAGFKKRPVLSAKGESYAKIVTALAQMKEGFDDFRKRLEMNGDVPDEVWQSALAAAGKA